jgi:hypothetical protein
MRSLRMAGAALLAAMAAACVPRAAPPAPAPAPPPEPAPLPPAPPQPAPPPMNWTDAPLSPGDWRYRKEGAAAIAVFQSEAASLVVRCDGGGSVGLVVTGSQAPALYINTSFGDRRLAAMPVTMNRTSVSLGAADPLLDQIAFSRGRFLVQAEGGIRLIVPAWPEIARVTEDCRQ